MVEYWDRRVAAAIMELSQEHAQLVASGFLFRLVRDALELIPLESQVAEELRGMTPASFAGHELQKEDIPVFRDLGLHHVFLEHATIACEEYQNREATARPHRAADRGARACLLTVEVFLDYLDMLDLSPVAPIHLVMSQEIDLQVGWVATPHLCTPPGLLRPALKRVRLAN